MTAQAATHDGDNTNPHQHALMLADAGYRVLPIRPGEKRPPMTAWQTAATTDTTTINSWWTGLYRDHGIGIATGALPDGRHLFVVDIDEHDPTASGTDTWHELLALYGTDEPDTVTTLTPTGGRHLYFTAPHPIPNDAGRRLGPGLDVRGTGGQVLAPPTIHPNGGRYEWEIDHAPWVVEPAAAPGWLLHLVTPTQTTPTPVPPAGSRTASVWDVIADDGPAARYNDTTTWHDLLTGDGWTLTHIDRSGEQHWTRPGKDGRDGTSATVGWNGRDILRVFTTSIPWLPEGAYSRFGYYACRHHNGNRSDAARTLRNATTSTSPEPVVVHQAADPGEPWPDPIPLHDHTRAPAFPMHTLPRWIADHATAVANDLQVAPDLPATLALGALSVATLGRTHIRYPRQNWRQPCNLYAAVALPPSAGKSPAKNAMFGPLEELEVTRMQQAAAARIRAESRRSVLDKRKRNLEDKAAKGGDDGRAAEFELLELVEEIANLDRVPTGRLLADDATTEALGVALADAGGHIAVVSAEGGIFDRIAGLYSDGASNFDLYLEAWGGGRYVVDRIKRDPISIPSANLVVITTVQPSVLDEVGAKRQFAGRGLTARFLLCMPDSNVGTRDRLRESSGDEVQRRTYAAHLVDLADRVHTAPIELTVTGTASDRFARWDQSLEHRLAPGDDLEHLAEWVGKLRANTLRVAALLHLAHQHPGTDIDEHTVGQAIEIGDYYLAHAQAIADRWGTDERVAKARKLADWVTRNGLTEFTARDILRNMRRTFADLDALRPAVELLVERGWIRPQFDGPFVAHTSRGKPSPGFLVHPDAGRHLEPSVSRVSPADPSVSPPGSVSRVSPPGSVSRVSPAESSVSRVSSPETPVDNPSVSRVSRVSRRGGIEPPTPSTSTSTPPPPNPVDTRDTRDTPTPTQPDPTRPDDDDPLALFD